MALKGLDIFKLSPKKNCKECGCPTCMAFSMKVASGAIELSKCPYFSADALASLSEATAPPMKTIKVGTGDAEQSLGGETVLFRHEKTFVSKTRYAARLCNSMDEATIDEKIAKVKAVDYDRIGERMYTEMVYVNHSEDAKVDFVELVKEAADIEGRVLIIDTKDVELAKAALEVSKDKKPILNGADASNYEAMSAVATEAGVALGVSGKRHQRALRYRSSSGETGQQESDHRLRQKLYQRGLCHRCSVPSCRYQRWQQNLRLSVSW